MTGEIDEMEDGAWIYMVSPTPEEIETVRLRYNVDESHIEKQHLMRRKALV